jgi:hypothetical protein
MGSSLVKTPDDGGDGSEDQQRQSGTGRKDYCGSWKEV